MMKAKQVFIWTCNLKGHGFHGDKATILYLAEKYYSLSVLSEKLYFLEIGTVNQKLWPFKCMMLKTLNSNFLDTLKVLLPWRGCWRCSVTQNVQFAPCHVHQSLLLPAETVRGCLVLRILHEITIIINAVTHFYRIGEEGGSGRPPPPSPLHRSFENRWRNIDILYIILKEIVWGFRFSLNYSKIFWFCDFMSKFSRNDSQWLPNGCPKKFQTFKIWIYIALKHVIWRFWICNYFREIFKFRDSMNTLRNFAEFVLLVFSRNIISREKIDINGISRSRALKWCIICSYFKSLKFFRTPIPEPLGVISRKFAHKVSKSKYFLKNSN